MTDGDRLICEHKTDEWYQDMYHMREYVDMSEYPKECGLCMMIKKQNVLGG